jgi:raffinose/stachyose/melibiose transport system permease protein
VLLKNVLAGMINMADIRKTNIVSMIVMYAIVRALTLLAIYPIFWLIIQSFKTTQDYMLHSKLAFPEEWFYRNYPLTWAIGNFTVLFLNSIFYTSVTVLSVIILSFMAGFAFAKLPSKITPLLHGSFIIGILITIQCIMVPLFLVVNWVGLYDTRLGVLIPYVGVGLPMAVYLSTAYIKGIPDSLIESARIDGAKYFRIFLSIIMPMAAPVAATVAILGVTGTWNEFMLINILVSNSSLKSLPVGINAFAGTMASDFGKQFAALVIGMTPMVVFYAIFRKQITKGVSAGAVKG